jgi:hypothetical protein
MLKVELDKETGTVTLLPEGALSAQDFEYASSVIDPYLESKGSNRPNPVLSWLGILWSVTQAF